jgi:hypothetical protein
MSGDLRLMHMTACIVAALGFAASACASGVTAASVGTPDTALARAAIAQAERAVRRAEAEHMLWTTSVEALRRARQAFESGELATAIAQARIAEKHAELAIAQERYATFRIR